MPPWQVSLMLGFQQPNAPRSYPKLGAFQPSKPVPNHKKAQQMMRPTRHNVATRLTRASELGNWHFAQNWTNLEPPGRKPNRRQPAYSPNPKKTPTRTYCRPRFALRCSHCLRRGGHIQPICRPLRARRYYLSVALPVPVPARGKPLPGWNTANMSSTPPPPGEHPTRHSYPGSRDVLATRPLPSN